MRRPAGLTRRCSPAPPKQIDPRVPVERPVNDRPTTPALAARLAELVAQARAGQAAFEPAAAAAEQLAASAGAPQSEGWTLAQEALSAAISAREPTARALGDIDALGGHRAADAGRALLPTTSARSRMPEPRSERSTSASRTGSRPSRRGSASSRARRPGPPASRRRRSHRRSAGWSPARSACR